MIEQPPGETPLDETPPGDTPPSANGPPSENIPPTSDNIPPVSDVTPPSFPTPPSDNGTPLMGDTPGGPEYPPPTISEELRADLCRVWSLGFLDAMKGEEVNDEDTIPSSITPHLVKLAEGCIDNAASFIAQVFVENPQAVYQTVYGVGFDVCAAMNAAYGPTEINLN